jgi:hypothetical protein
MMSVRGPVFPVPLGFTINAATSDGARAVLESQSICLQTDFFDVVLVR